MGILCDTPEGLVKPNEHDEVMEIVNKTITLSKKTGQGGYFNWRRPTME